MNVQGVNLYITQLILLRLNWGCATLTDRQMTMHLPLLYLLQYVPTVTVPISCLMNPTASCRSPSWCPWLFLNSTCTNCYWDRLLKPQLHFAVRNNTALVWAIKHIKMISCQIQPGGTLLSTLQQLSLPILLVSNLCKRRKKMFTNIWKLNVVMIYWCYKAMNSTFKIEREGPKQCPPVLVSWQKRQYVLMRPGLRLRGHICLCTLRLKSLRSPLVLHFVFLQFPLHNC